MSVCIIRMDLIAGDTLAELVVSQSLVDLD